MEIWMGVFGGLFEGPRVDIKEDLHRKLGISILPIVSFR